MTFDDFAPLVATEVSACPFELIEQQAKLATIEFCSKAHVWREQMDTLISDGFSDTFALPLDDQTEVAKVLYVSVLHDTMQQPDEPDIVEDIEGRRARDRMHPGQIAWAEGRRKLVISPKPGAGARISVVAALKPAMTAFSLPDEVFAHHAESIAFGVKARLLGMSAEWKDPVRARDCSAIFMDRINTAARAAKRGYQRRNRARAGTFF